MHAGHVCCGYCGKSVGAYCGNAYQQKGRTYRVPDRYRANKHDTDCPLVWHDAAPLDVAVWAEVRSSFATSAIIEVLLMQRRTDDPTEGDRLAIARSLDRIGRKQTNLLRAMAGLDDLDSREVLLAELTKLSEQQRALGAERFALTAQQARWQGDRQVLDALEAWCRQVANGLDDSNYERKREVLAALGVRVRLYAVDHNPRWEIETRITPGDFGISRQPRIIATPQPHKTTS